IRSPLDVVLNVSKRPPTLPLDDREVDDAEIVHAVRLEVRATGVGQAGRVAFADIDQDAAKLAANFDVVPPAHDREITQNTVGLAVLDDLLWPGQIREPGNTK